MKRAIKEALKGLLCKQFHLGQHLGFDILPRHFYSEIPDISRLRKTDHWRKPFSMIGVPGADVDDQLRFVRKTVSPELAERMSRGDIYRRACDQNGEPGFGPIEADFLHAFVVTHQPARIVQIGCGVSTAVCLKAAEESGYRPEMTCVDPYPTAFLVDSKEKGSLDLIEAAVETLDYSFFAQLGSGDLFFVDSTHTLGPAGEVSRIILEMLPRLKQGTRIHFHDVWFPYDYSGDILDSGLFFWHESVLLHAFLVNSERVRILASLSMLHHQKRADLVRILPNYKPSEEEYGVTIPEGHWPSSTYLQVAGA